MDIEHRFKIGDAHLFDGLFAVVPRIVDENVDARMLLEQVADPCLRLACILHVEGRCVCVGTEAGGSLTGLVEIAADDDDFGALGQHALGDGVTEPAGGTGDERRPAFEREGVCCCHYVCPCPMECVT